MSLTNTTVFATVVLIASCAPSQPEGFRLHGRFRGISAVARIGRK